MTTSKDLDEFRLIHLNKIIAKFETRKLTDTDRTAKRILNQIKCWEINYMVFPLLMDVLGLKEWEITYYFPYEDRMCVIVRSNNAYEGFYHNGYVEMAPENHGKHVKEFWDRLSLEGTGLSIESTGDTGALEQYDPLPDVLKNKWYLGFHTLLLSSEGLKYRGWGSFQNAMELTLILAKEMIEKGI